MKIAIKTCLFPMLFTAGMWAQRPQNMDAYFLGGPSFTTTQTIGGTNVRVYGSTGYSFTFGYGYRAIRKSAVSLWFEVAAPLYARPAAETATISDRIHLDSFMVVPSARLEAPVHSRISVFGAMGGGVGAFDYATITPDNPPKLTFNEVVHGVFSMGGGLDIRLSRSFSFSRGYPRLCDRPQSQRHPRPEPRHAHGGFCGPLLS